MKQGFLGAAIGMIASAAIAQPLTEAQKRGILLPYIRAATDCIAQSTLQNPTAIEAAQQNRGLDLASTARGTCLEALRKMVEVHDGLHGPNTGAVFLKGPYIEDLPRAVMTRIQPELARRTAEAERVEAIRKAELARQEAQNKQVEDERRKLINEANAEHYACVKKAMFDLVPFSNESAETVAIAIMAKCAEHETRRARLAATLYGMTTGDVKPIVAEAAEKMRKDVISEIVTFRAERAKASMGPQPANPSPATPDPVGKMY